MAQFDPTQPAPTLKEFQTDFQPSAADIDAIHGQPRTNEEKKTDETAIRGMETDGLAKHWSAPWFECKDLNSYRISNPAVEFPRIARVYGNILEVWQNNYNYGRKIQQNPQLRLPPFARLDQACNGDLEATNARRRKHLIGTIAYCWQLRKICEDEKQWLRQQSTQPKVIKPKKKDKKDKKDKTDDSKEEKEEKEEKASEEKEEKAAVNPFHWGSTTPSKMYNEMAKALVGVFFLCLCGFVPVNEIQNDLYYQKKYDAAHVFANHMAKLVYLTTTDNKPLFQVILNMICTGNTGRNFVFTHHLCNSINFESKHSSQSLREQASQLEQSLADLPATSSKRLQKLAQLQLIEKELATCATLNDQYIQIMKKKALQNRMDRKSKKVRPFPDYVYLRVFHELGLQKEALPFLQSWGITEEDYNRVWRRIDNGDLDNNLRRIICGVVSEKSKKRSAMDIDHHKLGIGPDYIKKKYSDLLTIYNEQMSENQMYDDNVAGMLDRGTDFLDHYGTVPPGGNPSETNTDGNRLLKEDEINTTMFAHKYLTGQIVKEKESEPTEDIPDETEEKKELPLETEEKKEIILSTDDGMDINIATVEKEEKLEPLPQNKAKLQKQLMRRRERLLRTMTSKYTISPVEVRRILELTDGRATALLPEEFYMFYGSQPIDLVNKFMDKGLGDKDREQMSVYLKNILDSYRRIQSEKMKLKDPAKHFGSLRSAVNAHQQSAMDRIDYTKKKYTEEFFRNVQQECEAFEKKLQAKKMNERRERRERLEAIKKLERKKRQRLTTPITYGNEAAEKKEEEQLKALQESEQVLLQNEKIIQENIAIQENNEHILDEFFDSADAKLKQSISAEAKEDRMRGVDDSGNNELGMQGFLERESNKNYGKIVAAKTDITPITEQVIQKKVERIRKKTLTQNQLQFPADELRSASASPHLGPYEDSGRSLQHMQSQNEKLQKLLQIMANSSQSEITADMRADAKSLLAPIGNGNSQVGYRSGFKSRSPSPMMSTPGHDSDEEAFPSGPPQGTGHRSTSSVVVHELNLDADTLADIAEEYSEHDHTPRDNHTLISPRDTDNLDMYGDREMSQSQGLESEMKDDPFKLPFDDIDIVEKDFSWLDTDELVPISRKDMLTNEEIAKLKVGNLPDMDVIRSDGLEQRERENAVSKLEKSYMADAAMKKARAKEREEMQKRLEEQKQAIVDAELKKESEEFDILKQGHIIRQKKTPEELKAELANLTPEQKAQRREERKARNKYMKENRNPKLLQELDRGIEEDTVMVDIDIDDFEMIPIGDTDIGKELAQSEQNLQAIEAKYGDGDESDGAGGPAVDLRQDRIFEMNTKEIYGYILEKTSIKEETVSKILECGVTGAMIEIAVMDGELEEVMSDMGFAPLETRNLSKVLKFDGWKTKETYPITMSGSVFGAWLSKNVSKNCMECVINNGLDGKTIGMCIEDGGTELKELLTDAGISDEKEMEMLRSSFVIDSTMVCEWTVSDVSQWLKVKLKSVKSIDKVIDTLRKNGIDGSKLLQSIGMIPSEDLSALGIEQTVQSKIRGKMNQICTQIDGMDCIELMYYIHGSNIENCAVIAQTLYAQKCDGKQLVTAPDLKTLLQKKLKNAKIGPKSIDSLVGIVGECVLKNGMFIPKYRIQDPNIKEYNEQTSNGGKGKGKRTKISKSERESMLKNAKRRHSRVQSKVEMQTGFVLGDDGKQYKRVYKGKIKVSHPQKIRNYSKKTITLAKANNIEQAKIRQARKQKYEKRRLEKAARHEQIKSVIQQQLEEGIEEANEMMGDRDTNENGFFSTDSEMTDSDEEQMSKIMMTHRSQMSTHRLSEKLEIGGIMGLGDEMNMEQKQGGLMVPQKKGAGRVTMAGQVLEDFVHGGDGQKSLFHKRRASSIVQRIVAKSQDDLQNFEMRRSSKARMSRRSLSGLSGRRHSRGFSSGHFVSQFFRNASDRQKIEAGMRGEAPLIVYYCDKDEETDEIRDIYQTSVLDTYIDDYSTFDDYIKILSMRLEQAQKKHRTEMDELRRNKEDLSSEVSALRTKKEELIRLIGQERSLFKRELPALKRAKDESRLSETDYKCAEQVIRDKFNETKLHVMTMMQFRDNHLRKLDEGKLARAHLAQSIQGIQSDIEELLSHYFTLQNAHNKLEHSVALLSELTTLCHEVNVRKKAEYSREITDLLAMIERYRCRIRNVDKLICQYQEEVVELRMLHEQRSAEFIKIQKNPTTNRTAATIDYYVAQRKLYEEKLKTQDSSFDDFVSVSHRYTKELSSKQQALTHYSQRSKLSDGKFKSAVLRKNAVYKECRDLVKALNISWKSAEKEYIERGHPLAVEFQAQATNMRQFETDSKPFGYEFVDPPTNTGIDTAFDAAILPKSNAQVLAEQELVTTKGDLGTEDIDESEVRSAKYHKIEANKTFEINAMASIANMSQMSALHRGDAEHALDTYRTPGITNMDEHPERAITATFDKVDQAYYRKYGAQPSALVNIENSTIETGPNDDDEDADEDYADHNNGISPPPSEDELQPQLGASERSVHFNSLQ